MPDLESNPFPSVEDNARSNYTRLGAMPTRTYVDGLTLFPPFHTNIKFYFVYFGKFNNEKSTYGGQIHNG